MTETKAFAAPDAASPLGPFTLERREPGPNDVQIEIMYCGVCHSDLHVARNEWNSTIYPVVPGHEIVGKVTKTGANVKNFKEGDLAGVGCFVDSCRECSNCLDGEEQYCKKGMTGTYSSLERESGKPTYGGYSERIVVNENYTLKIPANLPLEGVAPLLCAGITTYSPLRYLGVGKGHKIGVVGLGGLGHMAVKFASAFGAEVTMLSTSKSKEADARKLGAQHFELTTDPESLKKLKGTFDYIIDTVSAPHDYISLLSLLDTNGTMIIVGAPPAPIQVPGGVLIGGRKTIIGSLIGGIKETQEMLDYCGKHNITSDVEVIPVQEINNAYERMLKGDVRYRFVIDTTSLRK